MFQQIYSLAKQYPLFTFIVLLVVFWLLGDSIVTQYLMETQIKTMPRIIFTLTFMFSLSLLIMIIFEILQIGEKDLRIKLWQMSLTVLTLDCTLIIPNIIIFKILYLNMRNNHNIWSKFWLFITILMNVIYLQFVAKQSIQILQSKTYKETQFGIFSDIHINILIEFITHYGTWIMAVMSGYGAIWCPYVYFNYFFTKKQQLTISKNKVTSQIQFIVNSIIKIKYQILFLEQKKLQIQNRMKLTNSGSNKLIQFVSGLFKNKDQNKIEYIKITQKLHSSKNQIDTLEKVHKENYQRYKNLVDQERKHEISQTVLGRIFRLSSFVLSVYSVTRLILTIWNIINGRKISNDPITRLLNFAFWLTDKQSPEAYNMASSYISFGFMGYLIFSNVRSFSMNIKNLFDIIFRKGIMKQLQVDIIVLILSEMYGVYFLTALILMQMSLPKLYTQNLKIVTGQIQILSHFTFFDHIFLVCSIISILFIVLNQYQHKKKIKQNMHPESN